MVFRLLFANRSKLLSIGCVSSQIFTVVWQYTVIPRFWRPRFWRPSQIGDFIYLVSSWAHLLHTYNLDFGDFDFGDLNFDRSQKSPKSRDDCTVILTTNSQWAAMRTYEKSQIGWIVYQMKVWVFRWKLSNFICPRYLQNNFYDVFELSYFYAKFSFFIIFM